MILGRWRLPAWSAFDDRRTHEEFLEVVRAQLREADVAVDDDERGPVLDLGDGATLDLAALTTAAADTPPESWADAIRGRIASATNPNRPPSDPARLEPAVRVRLLTLEALEQFPKALPHRPHGDLAEVLVIDSGASLVWAGEADLEPLELELEELFDLARRNLRRSGPPRTSELDVAGATATLADGPGEYVASWALLLDELLDVPDGGAIVAVPTRGSLIALPLPGARPEDVDGDVLDALRAKVTERFEAGPGRISSSLHRWRDAELTSLD